MDHIPSSLSVPHYFGISNLCIRLLLSPIRLMIGTVLLSPSSPWITLAPNTKLYVAEEVLIAHLSHTYIIHTFPTHSDLLPRRLSRAPCLMRSTSLDY